MSGKRVRSSQGSMALEYALSLSVAVPFFWAWLNLYEPGVGWTEKGLLVTEYFQRVLIGVSMPVP